MIKFEEGFCLFSHNYLHFMKKVMSEKIVNIRQLQKFKQKKNPINKIELIIQLNLIIINTIKSAPYQY